MNWQVFKTHGEGPETAFEAFVTHLFEGWCRRTYAARLRDFRALDGSGGDGGVEAFAVLNDSTEIGLQAKWFQDKFDGRRADKVLASLQQACKRHPRLTKYIVCLPGNLSDAKDVKKAQKSERDRWDEVVAAANTEYPTVELVYWGDNELTRLLAEHDDGSLRSYWFDQHVLKPADLAVACKAAIKAHFAGRYLPDLHQEGRLDEVLDLVLCTAESRAVHLALLSQVQSALGRAKEDIQRLVRLPDTELQAAELQAAGTGCISALAKAIAFDELLKADVASGTPYPRTPSATDIPDVSDIYTLDAKLETLSTRSPRIHSVSTCARTLRNLRRFYGLLATITAHVKDRGRPLVIDGPPGVGKTHGIVATVDKRADVGLPVLLIAGNDVRPSDGLARLLGNAVGSPTASVHAVLTALEGAAVIADRKRAGSPSVNGAEVEPARALIVIDGLEESVDARRWPARLKELGEFLKKYPRIQLVVSTRDTTGFCVEGFVDDAQHISVRQTGATPLPQLFAAYCKHYNVAVEGSPWLPWALATPLAIRLFAEVHANQTVRAGTVLVTSIPKLLAAKIARIESELKQQPQTGWSAETSLLVPALRALAKAMVAKGGWIATADALAAIKDANVAAGLITSDRAIAILKACRTHGMVDAVAQPATDPLAPDELVYRPALNTVTDYLLADDVFDTMSPGEVPAARPPILQTRNQASAIVVAKLVDKGRDPVKERLWHQDVSDEFLARWQLRAIADTTKERAAAFSEWVGQQLVKSMPCCRAVLTELVLRVSRTPGHPFGAMFVDGILRPLSVAERDLFWSGPDRLPHNQGGPWEGKGPWSLDDEAIFDTDDAAGVPLLLAWSLASVVSSRRTIARAKLASWGGKNPVKMAALLKSMANVNDGQIVEDIFIAAAGAAMACAPDNADLAVLASAVDELLFADSPIDALARGGSSGPGLPQSVQSREPKSTQSTTTGAARRSSRPSAASTLGRWRVWIDWFKPALANVKRATLSLCRTLSIPLRDSQGGTTISKSSSAIETANSARTTNAIARHAGRIVLERAHLMGWGSPEMLLRARPPYKAQGPALLPFDSDKDAAADILRMDLGHYVAKQATEGFFEEYEDASADPGTTSRLLEDVDAAVLTAVAGQFPAAAEELAERERELAPFRNGLGLKMTLASETEPDSAIEEVSTNASDEEVDAFVAAMRAGKPTRNMLPPAADMLKEYAKAAGMNTLTSTELAEGLIVAKVKAYGWTEDRFTGKPNGEKPSKVLGADLAILRVHSAETHGDRSPVATFCEKYVFIAVNEIAGYMADRLPKDSGGFPSTPEQVTDYGELGAGMPDALAEFTPEDDEEASIDVQEQGWQPPGLTPSVALPPQPNALTHAMEWLYSAPAAPVTEWRHPGDPTQTILASSIPSHDLVSLGRGRMWISAFAATPEGMQRIRADCERGAVPMIFRDDLLKCSLGHATYTNPSMACWAPWLESVESICSYVTLDAQNKPAEVSIHVLVAEGVWKVPGVGERQVWMPGPLLRDAWGVHASEGDHERRLYIGKNNAVVAQFLDLRDGIQNHSILTADTALLSQALLQQGLELGWYVFYFREVPYDLRGDKRLERDWRRSFRAVMFADGTAYEFESRR